MGTQTLLMFVLAVVLGTADAPTRKWTDSTGQFTVEADMVDVRDGTVHLRIADGRIITVPLRELSPADQEFVRQATGDSSRTTLDVSTAGNRGVIRLPLYPDTFQRSVSIGAIDSDGMARATIVLADRFRPNGSLAPLAIPPVTEGYYLGLVGLPLSPDPIAELARGVSATGGLSVGCVEVVAVRDGGKLTVRIVSDASTQWKKDDSLLLLRPGLCGTAELRSIAEFVPVTDKRASSLGLTSETFLCLERSTENVRRIVKAIHLFSEKHKHLPPPVAYGPDGKPWHSWRVLILPYLGQQTLYEQYRLDEPWDGTNNSKLLASVPEVYRDPIHGPAKDPYAHYAAIVGSVVGFSEGPHKPLSFLSQAGTAFTGSTRELRVFTDGTSNTAFVGSIAPERCIPWTKPEDVLWRDDFPSLGSADGFAAPYRNGERTGGLLGLVDGSVFCVSDEIDIQIFRHLLQINDGRNIPKIPELRPGASNWTGFTVLEVLLDPARDSARLVVNPSQGQVSN